MGAVDVNGDGIDEVLARTSSYTGPLSLHAVTYIGGVYLGGLGPAIQSWPTSTLLLADPGHQTIRDLDGDGDRDVLILDAAQPALLMNNGVGGLVSVGGRTTGVGLTTQPLVGDLEVDGDLDLFWLSESVSGGVIVTSSNGGDGFFAPGVNIATILPPNSATNYSLHAFDRDGDGDSDVYAARNIFTAFSNAPHDVVLDRVGGTFVQSAIVTGTGDTSVFKTADFDADGDLDIILGRRGYATGTGNGITSPMLLLANNGAAGLGSPVPLGGNHATYDLEIGDFDGNGTLDVFQANANISSTGIGGPDPCVLYLFAPGLVYAPIPQTFSAFFTASGDLNGDGMTDSDRRRAGPVRGRRRHLPARDSPSVPARRPRDARRRRSRR